MRNQSPSTVSPRSVALGALLVVATVATAPASAQFASAIDLSSRSRQPTPEGWTSQLAISPFVRYDNARVALDARWTAFGGNGQRLDGFGGIGATYFSPTRAGFAIEATAFADRTLLNESFAVSRFGTDARVSYRFHQSGAWLGRELSRDNKSTPVSAVPHFSTGVWHQIGSTIVTLSLGSFGSRVGGNTTTTHTEIRPILTGPLAPIDSQQNFRSFDTVMVVDSGKAGRRHDWRDAELGMHWSAWRVAFDGLVGTRFSARNQPNETWGRVTGTLALAPQLALIGSAGVHPSSAAYGIARARFFEVGFRIAPSALRRPRLPVGVRPTAAAFRIDDAARGARTVRVRIPDARSVERSGDFTDWKPVSLVPGDGDEWDVTLPIAAGIHRVVIRVNGERWTTPPGIASIADEFQGTVGVIVVR